MSENKNLMKKELLDLYFESYTDDDRMDWYNQLDCERKRKIVNRYKVGEFANKISFTKEEFYTFQEQFKLKQLVYIGH